MAKRGWNWNPYFTADGNATDAVALENNLAASQIVKPELPALHLLGIYPKERKTYFYIKRYTQMFITALFIVDKDEKTQIPINWWINKCIMSTDGILFDHRKEWNIDTYHKMDEHDATWKKSVMRYHRYNMTSFIWNVQNR